jgi:hypothetical protein
MPAKNDRLLPVDIAQAYVPIKKPRKPPAPIQLLVLLRSIMIRLF